MTHARHTFTDVLTHANHLDNLNCAEGRTPDYASEAYQSEVQELRDLYEAILAHAQTEHPIAAFWLS